MPEAVAQDGLPAFLAQLERSCAEQGARADLVLSEAIADIDRRIEAQVDEILHHETFRRLEAAWNSLEYLVSIKPNDPLVKLRALNISREEMLADFEDAMEFDQTALFQQIYEAEYGQFGGEPYAVVLADFEFGSDPDDVFVLEGLSGVGAASHAMVLTGASPDLLGVGTWTNLAAHSVPQNIPGTAWNALRDRDDARYIGLVLPRVLLRAPYRPDDPDRELRLRENSFAKDGSGLLWGNAAFALAGRIMEAFHHYGWCTAIRGLEDSDGVVTGLPEISFDTDAPGAVPIPPVEAAISESFERTLTDLGLIPLCRVQGTPDLAFFGVPSLHRTRTMDDPALTTNLKLSAQIPYMLAASRVAHYLKAMMRDHIGEFSNPEAIKRELSAWLSNYTLADDQATRERQAQYPLRDFSVDIREKPGKPGEFEAITQLRPHFQVEVPGVSLRLAVDLPNPENTKR